MKQEKMSSISFEGRMHSGKRKVFGYANWKIDHYMQHIQSHFTIERSVNSWFHMVRVKQFIVYIADCVTPRND